MWIDAHSHLAFLISDDAVKEHLNNGRAAGIGRWLQGGYDPADWRRQGQLHQIFPQEIITCFGLHPWTLAAMTDQEMESALSQLEEEWSLDADAIGETGLDNVVATHAGDKDRQRMVFRRHLQLSESLQKPLVLHVVKAHGPALEELKRYQLNSGGIIHGFSGSLEVAKEYLRLGLLISVGPGVLKEGFTNLKETIKSLALNELVVESDSPDQPQAKTAQADLLLKVAEAVGSIKGVEAEQVLESSRQNLTGIFSGR